jgi:hypothetical protein
MPLVICPDCGKQMSDAAPSCPSCGRPNRGDMRPDPFGGATAAPPAPVRRSPYAELPRESGSNRGLVLAGIAFFAILAVIALGLRKSAPADPTAATRDTAVAMPVADAPGIENARLVTATDGQSRMTVPGNWREMTDLNDQAEIQVGDLFREQYAIVLTESREDFSDEVNLARFSELVSMNVRNGLADATMSEPRTLTVHGRPAVQRVIRGSKDHLRIVYWLTAIEGERSYFQVLMWTLASRADENEPVFQAVVRNFQEVPR